MQQQKATTARRTNPKVAVKGERSPKKTPPRVMRPRKIKTSNGPTFIPCALMGPDGQERPGWELWVGEVMFGRADSKESLTAYYTRLQEPMPSGHWRNRPMHRPQRNAVARQAQKEHDEYEFVEEQESALAEV